MVLELSPAPRCPPSTSASCPRRRTLSPPDLDPCANRSYSPLIPLLWMATWYAWTLHYLHSQPTIVFATIHVGPQPADTRTFLVHSASELARLSPLAPTPALPLRHPRTTGAEPTPLAQGWPLRISCKSAGPLDTCMHRCGHSAHTSLLHPPHLQCRPHQVAH
jgi:hypothetical protein